ncbi:MAG: hypothetical protein HY980_00920 [Candidatus Magasanikbacteria bacterium]|nr:hypothetical protein [Candidatus Magasanikbacteria bacterium]
MNLIKLGKKVFTLSVVVMTILWSVGVAALVPLVVVAADCPELEAGDLFKVPGDSAVYYVNADMKRMYFFNSEVYHTWYEDFSGVVEIAPTCTSAYPSGGGVSYLPGSFLVKTTISPDVYAVLPNKDLKKLADENAAKALYGTNWAKTVRDVPAIYYDTYTVASGSLDGTQPHDGMLVKKGTVTYQVVSGALHEVDGALPAFVAKYVLTPAEAVVDALEVSDTTVTAASVTEDAGQVEATAAEEEEAAEETATAAGNLTVSLATDTPAAAYAFASAARVPFTKVVFKAGDADVTIDSFKVKRAGSAAVDADFSAINVVTPEGNLLNDSGKTPNSDHEVTFTENITIPAGTSKTYTLVGDMAAAATMVAGNAPKLSLTAVTLVGTGTVTGLPVEGNAMTTNESLTLGTVTLAEGSTVGTVTKQVGATNVLVGSLKITNAGSTDTKSVKIEKLVFYNSGTTADADITTYKFKYNSNTVATGVMVNKYVTFDLSACGDDCTLPKGYDRTYDVYADLTGGSGRTINLDVQYATHAMVKDVNNSLYLTATDSATAMTNTVTISQGKINITKVNNIPAGNISKNASNVELASLNFNVIGEPIDVRTTVFQITTTGTTLPTSVDSIVLYDKDGKAVIGSVDGVGSASPGHATSTDTFTLQPGDNILTVKATIDNDSTVASGDTITIGIDMRGTTNFIAKGVNSSLDITLGTYATPQSLVSANVRTIMTSALSVTELSSPAASNYAPGTSNVTFEKVMLDASNSSEDLKVSQFLAIDTPASGAKVIDLQNIKLWVDKDGNSYNGTGTLVALTETVAGSESTANTHEHLTWNLSGDDQILVKAGKKLVVEVRADIAGGATAGTHTFTTNLANDVTATGQTTKTTVSESVDTTPSGQAMTVGVSGGTVEVSLATDNPGAKLMAAGTSATVAAFKFLATTTEDVEVDYLTLTQVNTGTASSSYKDCDDLWFEDSTGAEIAGSRTSPTSTLGHVYMDFADKAFVTKTSDSGKTIYLKCKLAVIGTGYNGVTGHYVGYKVLNAAHVTAKGASTGSGSVEYLSSTYTPTGNTNYVYKSYPVFAKVAVASNKLSNGTIDLFKFTITAVNGNVDLYGFTFDISTTTATVAASSLYLYDVTNASSEVQVNGTGGSGTYTGGGAVWATVGSDWTTNFSASEIAVSVSQPKTFVLRGNISGSATGASVSTGLAGDSAHVGLGTLSGSAEQVNSGLGQSNKKDFIWSDESGATTTHSILSNDWTNGYLVSGLPSSTSTKETVAY